MGFVDSLGVLILLAGVIFLIAYGIRHRGSVVHWLENLNHEENTPEKKDEIIRLQRKKEDITRDLERLERED